MTHENARTWLILSSLIITGFQMVFLLVAPHLGFPLESPKNIEILQNISPVFFGYLGSASHFIFKNSEPAPSVTNCHLGFLIKGPFCIYVLATVGAFAAFAYSNRAASNSGMTVESLTTSLSMALGVLAVTTGVLSSYLFAAPNGDQSHPRFNAAPENPS
ncbi:MAG: hypothetical protein NTY70_10650 [Burkholderiales bacterium]|nr:hypothetical protein [Burkholderiales bacterium]